MEKEPHRGGNMLNLHLLLSMLAFRANCFTLTRELPMDNLSFLPLAPEQLSEPLHAQCNIKKPVK